VAAPARTDPGTTAPARPRSTLYSAVIGLAALAVLLQGVWAGLFLREDGGYRDGWVQVHSHGAEVAIALAAVATIIAFVRLRARRDVWIGSLVFTVLLVLEAYLGGRISDQHSVASQVVHVPLALALMGLAVWLPLRASLRGRAAR
jgi:uncharacterized membrane protein